MVDTPKRAKMELPNDSSEYFESYDNLEIHKLMLEDFPRTDSYKSAIFNNKTLFKGKTIMDVGCGTGILSIFCAQAGAKKVYAIEASNLAKLAQKIIVENKFENIIEVIQKRVEDVELTGDIKVDVIISEWMGFYLLHEGMLDSVIYARDKFLKPDGYMFPESATIYVAPCKLPSFFDEWKNFHGVSMNAFAKCLRESKSNKPEVMLVQPENLLGDEVALCWINLKEDTVADLDKYSVKHVVGASQSGSYQGISVWFRCLFPYQNNSAVPICLCTSPFSLETHWKQTVVILPEQQTVEEGEPIAFELSMERSAESNRRYNLQVVLLDPEEVEHPLPCNCHMTKCILTKTFMMQHPERTDVPILEDIGDTADSAKDADS